MHWWMIKKRFRDAFRRLKNSLLEQLDRIHFQLSAASESHGFNSAFTVLFVGEGINYRILRFAKWLHKEKLAECALLFRRGMGSFPEEFSAHFRAIGTYRSYWDLARKLKQHSAISVIHGYGPPSYPVQAAIRYSNKPVTFDLYDVRVIYFGFDEKRCPIPWMRKKWIQQDVPIEKFCFEHARGIVARSLENRAAIQSYDFQVKSPRLFLPDYCDDENWVSLQDEVVQNRKPFAEGIHLVYAGGIAPSLLPSAFYGFAQLRPEIETITAQGLHLHIYPTGDWDALEEYRQIEKENPFFHFHKPVSQAKLPKTMAQYHFGINPTFWKEGMTLHPHKMTYAFSLKFFNFLEACLPVIGSEELRYQGWLIRRYKLGISVRRKELSGLRCQLENLDYRAMLKQVCEARKRFVLSRHVHRLSAHYHQIEQNHGTVTRSDSSTYS